MRLSCLAFDDSALEFGQQFPEVGLGQLVEQLVDVAGLLGWF
jgi:hypothetical protein